MNKTLAALAGTGVFIVGGATGLAAWSGGAVTNRLTQQTQALTKFFPIKVVDEQVERGLFSSTRTVTLQLGCLPTAMPGVSVGSGQASPEQLQIRWRDHVQHAPLPSGALGLATVDSELLLSDSLSAQLHKALDGKPPLRVHTEIGFTGKFVSELMLAGVHVDDVGQGSFVSKPIAARITGSAGGSRPSEYALEIPGIDLRADAHRKSLALTLGRIQAHSELLPQAGLAAWLSPAKTSGVLTSLELSSSPGARAGKPMRARFEDVRFSAESTLHDGLWSSTHRVAFKGKVDDFAIDAIELQTSMKRVHAESYQALLSRLMDSAFSCDPAAQAALTPPDLQKELGRLLLHDPEYSLDTLAIELDGKRAELSYAAGTRGVTAADLQGDMSELLTRKAVVHASAKVDLDLIAHVLTKIAQSMPADAAAAGMQTPSDAAQATALVDGMVGQFVRSGYLLRDGGSIKASATFEGGKLLVNGKPMALSDLGAPP